MHKNLLSPQLASEMLQRVHKLTRDKPCLWGNMTATTMLYHCNVTNNAILTAPRSQKMQTLKQKILKVLILQLKKEIPKGIKGNPKFFPEKDTQLDFEEQLKVWVSTISKFSELNSSLEGDHPVFGRLNTKEWGRFVWLHMDHHLRQFGI